MICFDGFYLISNDYVTSHSGIVWGKNLLSPLVITPWGGVKTINPILIRNF